jgi:hypothetical protein
VITVAALVGRLQPLCRAALHIVELSADIILNVDWKLEPAVIQSGEQLMEVGLLSSQSMI